MVNEEHLRILRQGVEAWNRWRAETGVRPNLYRADLSGANLVGANLHGVNLDEANLSRACLHGADFRMARLDGANLSRADLRKAYLDWAHFGGADLRNVNLRGASLGGANLGGANLSQATLYQTDLTGANLALANLAKANLTNANLSWASLTKTDCSGANLAGARLDGAQLIHTNLQDADLTGCHIYGISAWDLQLEGATQDNFVITPDDEPIVTVDNLEVAQFIYLLLNNKKIRSVIDTIGQKAVLILGRFTDERKAVLDAIREALRRRDYLPILFDFDAPSSQNLTETVSTLAHLSRFVIADITDAKSIPQELQRIVPNNPSLPVQPLILSSQYEYAMFKDFLDYHWVLMPYRYDSLDELLDSLEEKVVLPATTKAQEIEQRRKAMERKLAEGTE